jgi:hypothetical protein
MFSGVWSQRSFTWLRLFGVTGDGREFALDANRFIAPFDQSRLPKVLQQMLDKPDGDQHLRAVHAQLRVLDPLAQGTVAKRRVPRRHGARHGSCARRRQFTGARRRRLSGGTLSAPLDTARKGIQPGRRLEHRVIDETRSVS